MIIIIVIIDVDAVLTVRWTHVANA